MDKEKVKEYNNELKGTRIPHGVVVQKVSSHAVERAVERDFSPFELKETLLEYTMSYPGNSTNSNSNVYQLDNKRIVVGKNGNIITVIDLNRKGG